MMRLGVPGQPFLRPLAVGCARTRAPSGGFPSGRKVSGVLDSWTGRGGWGATADATRFLLSWQGVERVRAPSARRSRPLSDWALRPRASGVGDLKPENAHGVWRRRLVHGSANVRRGGASQVKLTRVVLGSAIAASLVGGSLMAAPVAAQDDCVAIYGGDVFNETVIDLNANAGTAISDASGGSNNAATTGGGGEGLDVASSGNGGVANAAANGGAIGTGNINSGGNVGNAIAVGDTHCAEAVAPEKAPEKKAGKAEEEAAVGGEVVALPDTGVGVGEANALFALLASAGAAAASLGLRRR
jgi:hypothetical protein